MYYCVIVGISVSLLCDSRSLFLPPKKLLISYTVPLLLSLSSNGHDHGKPQIPFFLPAACGTDSRVSEQTGGTWHVVRHFLVNLDVPRTTYYVPRTTFFWCPSSNGFSTSKRHCHCAMKKKEAKFHFIEINSAHKSSLCLA